nr:MAG TPA_asm: restriction endonuclease [Caudoviricetes sp.]
MRESIDSLKAQADRATGKRRFELKKQVISQYRDLVVAGESSNPTPAPVARASMPPDAPGLLDDEIVVDPVTLLPHGRRGLTMCDERCVLALMRDYVALKALSNGDARSDVSALLADLEEAVDALYRDDAPMRLMVELKLGNATDADVAQAIGERLGVHRSASYWGARWSIHVPRAVADRARRLWLLRHWDKWKICTRCGRALPAHPMWFTKNSSRDGYYSRCKECRTAVRKEREDADRRGV